MHFYKLFSSLTLNCQYFFLSSTSTTEVRIERRYHPQQLTNKFLREVEHVWVHQRIVSCVYEHNWHTDVVKVVGRAVIAVQLLYTSEPKNASVRSKFCLKFVRWCVVKFPYLAAHKIHFLFSK